MTTNKNSGGEGVVMLFSKTLCFDFMDEALQVPVRLECGPDVRRIQQCFYRTRQYCQARSNYRYDDLGFHVRGPTLVIRKRSVPAASQLRRRAEALQELSECVAPHDIDVDCPGGTDWQKSRGIPNGQLP